MFPTSLSIKLLWFNFLSEQNQTKSDFPFFILFPMKLNWKQNHYRNIWMFFLLIGHDTTASSVHRFFSLFPPSQHRILRVLKKKVYLFVTRLVFESKPATFHNKTIKIFLIFYSKPNCYSGMKKEQDN